MGWINCLWVVHHPLRAPSTFYVGVFRTGSTCAPETTVHTLVHTDAAPRCSQLEDHQTNSFDGSPPILTKTAPKTTPGVPDAHYCPPSI